ncbi:signal peptide peptidase SppA [Chitinophagaceae bacterium LB-8]|uniref:Signal peptide peptidase SppA n=1 Tax=Paraflavisolibacter caeni TaxID=2982496 RepID=A0A9X2XQ24_9BACT|nr:signal peptide peptidase SppA [Paraflavisolibacter caeni]MCU7552449.1 signal peptide peptidase SppA [Paraflavisolibacter caeni]
MRSFFKIFLASFLAIVVAVLILVFLIVGAIGGITSSNKPRVEEKTVLVLDLSKEFKEQSENEIINPFGEEEGKKPGIYDVIRLLYHAKSDNKISGIFIIANGNSNGFAASNELRNAILDFKSSKKFVIAHGDLMTQKAYFIASAADRIYANPAGNLDWTGFNVDLAFLKGTLNKLDIQPQVFYAGKFKSATEPFRTDKMTPENRLQTSEWLNDLYNYFLVKVSASRKIDTATLHQLANIAAIQTPQDAYSHKLVDGLKYDDEVKEEIKRRLNIGKWDKLHFLSINDYYEAAHYKSTGKDRIAVIYAEGEIVDGEGTQNNIGGDKFRRIIRKARLDRTVKAIVLRVNSGGGSALASENIWRELAMARQDKPVVVSFGDVAASGGYYIACGADSIFASPNTITGSIGVFTLIPNMKDFFNNKLGITFDGVKTAEYADAGAVYRPLNEREQKLMQNSVDRIYLQFKQRVAKGRKKDMAYVDSIAQGRVWSGDDAIKLGLVDKIGGLQSAIDCAARMVKTNNYRLREYPEKTNWLERILNPSKSSDEANFIKQQVGEENFKVYQQLLRIRQLCGTAQARIPFEFYLH